MWTCAYELVSVFVENSPGASNSGFNQWPFVLPRRACNEARPSMY